MSYPPYPISHRTRLTILITLIVSFFIISPVIILHTAGYRYDWSRGVFLTTGVLSIEAEPKDAIIFINGREMQKRLPLRLKNLAPGTYHVTLHKPGYIPWAKDVTIESNKTTYIKHLTLLRESKPALVKSTEEVITTSLSPDGAYTLIVREVGTNSFEVVLFETRTKKETSFGNFNASEAPHIEWSPFKPLALITWSDDQRHLRLIQADTARHVAEYEYTLSSDPIVRTQWTTDESLTVLFEENLHIQRVSPQGVSLVATLETSTPWHVTSDGIWLYDNDHQSITLLGDGLQQKSIAVDGPVQSFVDSNTDRVIIRRPDAIDIIKRSEGAYNTDTIYAQSMIYNSGTEEWTVWSPWELWAIYRDGATTLLHRTSEPIHHVRPLDEFGLLLVVTEKNLTAFNPGYYVSQHLLQSDQTIEQIGADTKSRTIGFHGIVDGQTGIFSLQY